MFVWREYSKARSQKKLLCVLITQVNKNFKSSRFSNISNFHNSLVWNPSKVQTSPFKQIARFQQKVLFLQNKVL